MLPVSECNKSTLHRNLRTGVTGGMYFALAYSAFVILMYLVNGSRAFDKHGTTLGKIIAAYVISGIGGGLIVGLMLPLAKNKLGRTFLGIVVGVFVFFWITMTYAGPPTRWGDAEWFSCITSGVILGAICSNGLWKIMR
jgi:hypothetical protein